MGISTGASGIARNQGAADAAVRPASSEHVSKPAGRRREDRIVGSSEAIRRLIAAATEAARSDLPVWLSGPAGSDKELVARAIHDWSARNSREFRVISCAAIPEALQGRELFGCAEGVYPAIPGEYAGALAAAEATTLLVDGVEDLRPETRQALIETVRQRRFRREGDSRERPLQARLILSTSATGGSGLGEPPHHGIQLVPLADRPEDVLPLALHYLRAFAQDAGVTPVGFTADARACLEGEVWSGDVQELRTRVRAAVQLGGGAVSAEALVLAKDADEVPSFKDAKRAFETRYVTSLLRRCGGNISRAARLAKKDRKDFYDVIRRTGVNPEDFRG
jgi:two-component system response regulator GlrR